MAALYRVFFVYSDPSSIKKKIKWVKNRREYYTQTPRQFLWKAILVQYLSLCFQYTKYSWLQNSNNNTVKLFFFPVNSCWCLNIYFRGKMINTAMKFASYDLKVKIRVPLMSQEIGYLQNFILYSWIYPNSLCTSSTMQWGTEKGPD